MYLFAFEAESPVAQAGLNLQYVAKARLELLNSQMLGSSPPRPLNAPFKLTQATSTMPRKKSTVESESFAAEPGMLLPSWQRGHAN